MLTAVAFCLSGGRKRCVNLEEYVICLFLGVVADTAQNVATKVIPLKQVLLMLTLAVLLMRPANRRHL